MAKHVQIVVFGIGRESFGVPIDVVQEIVRVPEVTAVPDAPGFLEGVINLRGRIVPVVDLRRRLNLARAGRTRSSRVLITENGGSTVGLLVDSVSEVLKLQPDAVEAPPEMISAIGIEYITGVARTGERLIIFLDLKKVLDAEDMKRRGSAIEEAAAPLAV